MRTGIQISTWLLALLLLASCTQGATLPTAGADTKGGFSDPFAYCAAVGTIDSPDARYTGPKVPLVIARGLRQAFDAPKDAPLDPFVRNTSWRCMNGKVYACNVGANLPCQEKADTSRTPNQGMVRYCKEHPESEVIPAVAAGRATVYLWRCREGGPEIVRRIARADARGFLAHIWYRIEPGNEQ